jgi:hypothetical protein
MKRHVNRWIVAGLLAAAAIAGIWLAAHLLLTEPALPGALSARP